MKSQHSCSKDIIPSNSDPSSPSKMKITVVTTILATSVSFVAAFVTTYRRQNYRTTRCRAHVSLNMALTPVGPFCPFRSSASMEVSPKMESLNAQTPEFATEMSRIQLDVQLGKMPDKDRLLKVANGIDAAVDQWEILLARLSLSGDFQTKEYAKLTQAHLESHGISPKGIATMMKWQSGCMKAMALNRPPPMPPSDLDLNKLMAQAQQSKPPPSMTAMVSAEKITSSPFTESDSIFDTPLVKEEYDKLCQDHASLIEMGAKYTNFDCSGKLAYLDAIDVIGDRWDVFFTRFSLMGKLDKTFTRQCAEFLASMSLNEDEYRKLLKKAHQIMRQDAELERDSVQF